jgi:hypothetical protein
LDHELSGNEIIDRRVRFKLTKDPNFGLGFNDLGTVVGVTDFSYHGERQKRLLIGWDNYGNYTSMEGLNSLNVFQMQIPRYT